MRVCFRVRQNETARYGFVNSPLLPRLGFEMWVGRLKGMKQGLHYEMKMRVLY